MNPDYKPVKCEHCGRDDVNPWFMGVLPMKDDGETRHSHYRQHTFCDRDCFMFYLIDYYTHHWDALISHDVAL